MPSFSPGSSRGDGRIRRPTRKAPVTVELPAYAALVVGRQNGRAASWCPIWRPSRCACTDRPSDTCRLAAASVAATLPTLVVATTDDRRAAWTRLLDDVARSRRGAPLDARIVTWRELRDDRYALDDVAAAARPTSTVLRA